MRGVARQAALALLGILTAALLAAGPASADNDFSQYRIVSASATLSSAQAGAHADFTTAFTLSATEGLNPDPYGYTRDVIVRLPPGLAGNVQAVPRCTFLQFADWDPQSPAQHGSCQQDSQVGVAHLQLGGSSNGSFTEPIFNLEASGGDVVARFGFYAAIYPVVVNVRLDPEDHTLVAAVEGAPAPATLISAETTFWGVPADTSHNALRLNVQEGIEGKLPPGGRESTQPEVPFITNPTECATPKQVLFTAVSYQLPDAPSTLSAPFPQIGGCDSVDFMPEVSAQPTTSQATTPTGLGFKLSLPTDGLELPHISAGSQLKRTEVILPEGMTVNPSAAEGLGVCTEADLARETYDSGPNAGCPETSKLGSVTATTPVIDRDAVGSLYLAKPYENPFDALLGLYLVVKIPDRGVLVKIPGKVEPDPRTGQLITTFDDIPQLPVGTVSLSFREGARAPLLTPPACGSYQVVANLTPWARPDQTVRRVSTFEVGSGPNRGPCPAGSPPFHPGFFAGTENNAAGSFSPFSMRLTRQDEDQDLTKFSATLPPGLVAKLAGTSFCPDDAIAQARSRSGPREGALELAFPSCPASSEVGDVLAGAGAGQVLTYARGKVYLAGPYNGAPLSIVGIVPAVAGPFDVGTVVTRQALRIDPRTGVVNVDGSSSDPIPHILAGIPLKVRDIRVSVDRPEFTLNPTSCEPFAVEATLWGGGLDAFSSADDSPYGASSRFQAADCGALGFQPRLKVALRGGTKRNGHPSLRGVFQPRPGDANLQGLVLRLPHSAFIDQNHIRTVCTRVQFAANGGHGGGCPERSIYGWSKAWTPILDAPLEGPVYLRSNPNHSLPDLVAALHGLVDVEAVARIDSIHGGIRTTFTDVPDAPLSKVVVSMQGGEKGLIVNSRDLCYRPGGNRANAFLTAQNGRRLKNRPLVRAVDCAKGSKGKQDRGRGSKAGRR
jgi:hypothetical protein